MKYKPLGESVKKYLLTCVAASALAVGAGAASAATFKVDLDNSSFDLVNENSGLLCRFSGCEVDVAWADGLKDLTFDLTNPGDFAHFDFLTFTGDNSGGVLYSIQATLAFSSPEALTASGSGFGGATLRRGNITSGFLVWNDGATNTIDFGNGGKATVDFVGGLALFRGSEVTTKARVTLDVAEIPLPAAGWLLLAGLGGLAAMRRRKTTDI